MDFRKLLQQIDTISEADEESDAYKELTKNVPKAPSGKPDLNAAPNIDNVSGMNDKTAVPSTGEPESTVQQPSQQVAQQSGPLPTEVSNLRKQLNDLSTKLWQMNQQSIETGKYEGYSNIAQSLLESFQIFEADGGEMTNQRNQLVSQINTIIKQLEPYKNNPDVAQDIARAQKGMQAPVKPGPMYNVNDKKIKRYQELMAKLQGGGSAQQSSGTSPKPSGNATQPSGGSAQTAAQPQTSYNKKVMAMQNELQQAGGNLGPSGVDGNLGKFTKAAMQQFPEIAKKYFPSVNVKPVSGGSAQTNTQPETKPSGDLSPETLATLQQIQQLMGGK